MPDMYKHCKLRKGNRWQMAWVPVKFAVLGSTIRLRDNTTKQWEDGWKVEWVGSSEKSEETLDWLPRTLVKRK